MPVGGLRDDDIGLAAFGHQLRIPLGGLFREIGKTLFGSLEFVRNHKSKSTQPVQSVQPPLPHLKLVPRAQQGQFGDLQEMGIIAEHCRADVERAASDQ